MDRRSSKLILLCGWSKNGEYVVRDLLSGPTPPRVLVVAEKNVQLTPPLSESPRVEIRRGAFEDPDVLDSLPLDDADALLLLSPESTRERTTGDDAMIILRAMVARHAAPTLRIIAEIRDHEHENAALEAGVDEVLVSRRYAGVMLSRALVNPSMATVFSDLFAPGEGISLITNDSPSSLWGATFSQALELTSRENRGVLLGLYRRGEFLVPPKKNHPIQEGDLLVLLTALEGQS